MRGAGRASGQYSRPICGLPTPCPRIHPQTPGGHHCGEGPGQVPSTRGLFWSWCSPARAGTSSRPLAAGPGRTPIAAQTSALPARFPETPRFPCGLGVCKKPKPRAPPLSAGPGRGD